VAALPTMLADMNSRWDATLTDHLDQIAADWPEVAPRVSDEAVRDAIVGVQAEAKASDVHEAQEERGRRQDQGSIDDARALNRTVLEDTRREVGHIAKVLEDGGGVAPAACDPPRPAARVAASGRGPSQREVA
jgi:hypothetical protein